MEPPDDAQTGPPVATGAPKVTALVTACDPGPWFDETLASLAAQDYPALAVLVVDAGRGDHDAFTARVRDILPEARVERVEGASLTRAAGAVRDDPALGPFLVLCHDDVRLAPDAVRLLLEELFRSNAGIVGPKLVSWDDERRLRQVGATVDKTGEVAGLVEPGELDQEQHDAVRDVFLVPGACTLIRTDLFRVLGGYDEHMRVVGEDRDLCWRAHVAGARVLVAPAARVAHREELDRRLDPAERVRLDHHHRLRTVFTCLTPWHLVRVVPQALVLTLVEAVVALLSGRSRESRAEITAWLANVRDLGAIRARRRELAGIRRVGDSEVRRLQLRGSARLATYLRGQAAGDTERFDQSGALSRTVAARLRVPEVQRSIALWVVVVLVVLVGSRQLITSGIPATGELVAFPESPGAALDEFRSSPPLAGLQGASPAPSLLAALGLAGVVALGEMALLRTVLVVGALLVGLAGAWRLGHPLGDRRAQAVALVAYLACPVGVNAVAEAHLSALVLYALAPFLLGVLARATGQHPFAAPRPVHSVLVLTLLVGLGSLVVPLTGAIVVLVALGLAAGSALAGQPRGAGRVIGVGIAGALGGWLLQLPWSTVWLSEWDAFARPRQSPVEVLDGSELLRFATGPVGGSVLGWSLLVAAALALLIGRDWRLAWAVRGWTVALVAWGAAFAATEGWWPGAAPPLGVLLAPAGAGLALAVAMGMAAFAVDLRDFHFGWRQLASLVAGLALVFAALPVLARAVADGRWGGPGADLTATLSFLDDEVAEEPFLVLWLGDPEITPLTGWTFDDAAVYQVTVGLPAVRDLFPGDADGDDEPVRAALDGAARGDTARLGAELAPLGVRYVLVPVSLQAGSDDVVIPDSAVVAALPEQLDLARVEISGAVQVWENTAWDGAGDVVATPDPSGGRTLVLVVAAAAWLLVAAAAVRTRGPAPVPTTSAAAPPDPPVGQAPPPPRADDGAEPLRPPVADEPGLRS